MTRSRHFGIPCTIRQGRSVSNAEGRMDETGAAQKRSRADACSLAGASLGAAVLGLVLSTAAQGKRVHSDHAEYDDDCAEHLRSSQGKYGGQKRSAGGGSCGKPIRERLSAPVCSAAKPLGQPKRDGCPRHRRSATTLTDAMPRRGSVVSAPSSWCVQRTNNCVT